MSEDKSRENTPGAEEQQADAAMNAQDGRENASTQENGIKPDASQEAARTVEKAGDPGANKAAEDAKDRPIPVGNSTGGISAQERPADNTESQQVDLTKTGDGTPDSYEKPQPSAVPLGAWNSIFRGCVKAGPLAILLALACMVWPDFWKPAESLYCPAEFRTISAFLHCIAQSSWIAPTALADGAWQIAQWPGFYWFTGLLAFIPGVADSGLLFAITGAAAAALAILAVWGLANAAGFGCAAAFAGGLILLCAPLFAPLPHFIGAGALAAAIMLFSLLCFCRGWQAKRSWLSLPAGFVLAGFAGLTGGVFHFALPLLASFCFLLWRGNLRRAQSLDALFGFVLLLALLGAWLGTIMLNGSTGDYLPLLFANSIKIGWPLEPGWWLAMLLAGFGLLPWLMEIFGVSWVRVLAESPKILKASRHENGSALVWIAIVLGLGASIFFPQGHIVAVALVCMAAPLLGKAFVNMPPLGNRIFFLLASLCLIIAGLLLLCASFSFSQDWLWAIFGFTPGTDIANGLLSISAIPVLGAILFVGGILGLFFVKKHRGGGGLVYSALLAIILAQPCLLMLAPQLGARPESGLVTFGAIENAVAAAMSATPAPEPVPAVPGAEPEMAPAEPASPPETQEQPESAAVPETEAQPQEAPGNSTEPAMPEIVIVPDSGQSVPAAPETQPEPKVEEIIIEKTPDNIQENAEPVN